MTHVLEATDSNNHDVSVATFYSISSTQPGLSGVDLGKVLLQSAVQLLRQEFDSLDTFVTLSPIPRFRKWFQDKISFHNQEGSTFKDDALIPPEDMKEWQEVLGCRSEEEVSVRLAELLQDPTEMMEQHVGNDGMLETVLTRLVARYLVLEKHRRKPLDLVARFHLHNGAELYRINYMADTSRKGWHNSLGLMVNYRYNLAELEENQVKYDKEDEIQVREEVRNLLPKTKAGEAGVTSIN